MNTVAPNRLVDIIASPVDEVRDSSIDAICETASLAELLDHANALDAFRRSEPNLYHRVRALFFLQSIYRYHLPKRLPADDAGLIPYDGYEHLLGRRFLEAIDVFLQHQQTCGPSDSIASALAAAYHQLGFQTLADQVRRSVRTFRGNQWMFRLGHPADHPLRLRPEMLAADPATGTMPILRERTAVRMDFSHSAWSDIFFLGMDFPAGARVLNVSINLGVRGRDAQPLPPIETYLRVIDKPVIRLTSVDLGATTEVESIGEMFDFARDYLGLLKAAVIASGVVAPGLEGCGQPIGDVLRRIVGDGKGLEVASKINDIPKGSRLAVSTNLLGSLISLLMRATGQVATLVGPLAEPERRVVAARAILGEWIGGSGGGWQDSGGVWPGIKAICGTTAQSGDPEFGISRGRLMPVHHVMGEDEVSADTRRKLQESLVLVHGGMAQNVGPILEMVTEHYLQRNRSQWAGRREAMRIFDAIIAALKEGDIKEVGRLTTENFEGPLQTIIPWATNRFTDTLISAAREKYQDRFWGFWMLGGMSGGGMGFIFDPAIKQEAQSWLAETMVTVKRDLQTALPFAMDPVVYDFQINDDGTTADLLTGDHADLPDRYYALVLPGLLRIAPRDLSPQRRQDLQRISGLCIAQSPDQSSNKTANLLLASVLPEPEVTGPRRSGLQSLLAQCGFDRQQHEQIRSDMRAGRIGLSQNRLSNNTPITDVTPDDVTDLRGEVPDSVVMAGRDAMRRGEVAIVTLAAGVGSRWTQGAGVCKALHPFHRFAGRHRSFIEVHLAKNRLSRQTGGGVIPHVITTSHLTDEPIRRYLQANDDFGMRESVYVSTGRSVGLRMIPMVRDLTFLWEETAQQILDEQQQKVRESGRAALIQWTRSIGEGNDYTDNMPSQCIHPVGHWYEVPNLLRSGTLQRMLQDHGGLKYLMLHNIDTLGATVDPKFLGQHITGGSTLSFEVIPRRLEDRGGGLAIVGGTPRLVEGLAMPNEQAEFSLSYYNSMTTWIDIDGLLAAFSLVRADLDDSEKVDTAIRRLALRLPTYVTIKDVKKRWGHAQEDVFPVAQFEKLWGDMTALHDVSSQFVVTDQRRGQQLKSQAQLDPWHRDGTAQYVESLCKF
jgi:galactokinase/mevalonate kinase-like predicted kinase